MRKIRMSRFIAGLIAIIMCVVLCGCQGPETQDPPEIPEQTVTEETGDSQPEDETAGESGEKDEGGSQTADEVTGEPVEVEDDANFGNMMASDALTRIRNIQMGTEEDQGFLAPDIAEYLFFGPNDKERKLYYDLTDINGDGYRELIIGGANDNGTISPMGVYMYKDEQLFRPQLSYLVAILSDGIVHSYQGNGVPDEDHQDGYYFRIDPSANDGVVEVSPSSAGEKDFNWKQF